MKEERCNCAAWASTSKRGGGVKRWGGRKGREMFTVGAQTNLLLHLQLLFLPFLLPSQSSGGG